MARRKNIPEGMPAYSDLINPTITALQSLGGSGKIDEIYNEVLKELTLPDEIIDFQHSEKSSQSELQYRLAWARTYLKNYAVYLERKMKNHLRALIIWKRMVLICQKKLNREELSSMIFF